MTNLSCESAALRVDAAPALAANRARPKRQVLLVGNFLSASLGIRAVCEDLALRLSASEWRVLTSSRKRPPLRRLLDMLSAVWNGRASYAVAHVDVFSGRAFLWAETVCAALRLLRKPYVLTLHGGNLPVFARRSPRRVRQLLQSAAAVTTPSRYLLDAMSPYRPDLRLLPNPIQLEAYPWRVRRRPRPHLVWMRSFHSIYNPGLAPRVLARIAPEFPESRLIMVGPDRGDGSREGTGRVVESLGLSARVSMPGAVEKSSVPAWLERGDIFLNTANIDNTPVGVLEALACGLCVVSTDVGGIPYLLEHERDALLVAAEDPEAMSRAVRRILTEPELAERLSSSARRKAEQFDWQVILPQWEALLSSVAATHADA